jgi:hypothetical protein
MPDTSSCSCSEVHARAICDEVGERLRILLDRTQTPTLPRISALLLQFQLHELQALPSVSGEQAPKSKSAA